MKLFEKMDKLPPDVLVTHEGHIIATESYIRRVIEKVRKQFNKHETIQ